MMLELSLKGDTFQVKRVGEEIQVKYRIRKSREESAGGL